MASDKNETAKAVKQVAKTAEKAMDIAGERLTDWVGKVLGEPIAEASGMLTDKLKVLRFERGVRLMNRVNEIRELTQKDVEFVRVAPKLALPALDAGTLENDNDLQDLWAHLLASATLPNSSALVRSAFVDMIKQMEVRDAVVLQHCYHRYRVSEYVRRILNFKDLSTLTESTYENPIYVDKIVMALDFGVDVINESIDNLIRLRLLKSHIEYQELTTPSHGMVNSTRIRETSLNHGSSQFELTYLGIKFIEICTRLSGPEAEIGFKKEAELIAEDHRKNS